MNASEHDGKREAVRQAVLAYIDAAIEVNPALIEGAVHPGLAKLGFYRDGSGYSESRMTYTELVDIVKTYNADGHIHPDSPKTVTVYEVLDKTASARLETVLGIEYLHLAEYDGKWIIVQVLWQSHPCVPKD